jgi:hypothetical protein
MKKTAIIILSLFLAAGSLAQIGEEAYINPDKKDIATGFSNRKMKGYYNIIQVSLLMGSNQSANRIISYTADSYSSLISPVYYYPDTHHKLTVSPSVTMTNGYMFNKHWAAGAGVGFEIFDHFLFPLFAEFRYTLRDKKISPYLNLKGGYAFGNFKPRHFDHLFLNWSPYQINDAGLRHFGGMLLYPEIGIKVPLDENDDLLLTAAYRYQKSKSVLRKDFDQGQFEEWEHKGTINRLSLGVAILFR